jgi:predicted DNA-binding transcriptional regulator YafY
MTRARRGVNIRQFAERHGWNLRALYRDIETLRKAGVPVEHPEHGWFSVSERCLPLGTVDVRPDELTALAVARKLAPGLKDTAIGRGLDSLWSKLSTTGHQQALPLDNETWFQIGAPPAIDYGPHRIVFDAVHDAVRTRRVLRIQYRKPDGEPSERVIEPAFVQWDPALEALYVSAWCRERGAQRVFALHRITRAELTDEPFAPRREAVAEMSRAYRLWARPGTQRVVLRFSPRVAGEVRERGWHRSARLTDTDDGGVVIAMEIGAPEELERWLLGYGADVQVEEPAALAEQIRQRHAEAAAPARLGTLRARRPRSAETAAPQPARSKP